MRGHAPPAALRSSQHAGSPAPCGGRSRSYARGRDPAWIALSTCCFDRLPPSRSIRQNEPLPCGTDHTINPAIRDVSGVFGVAPDRLTVRKFDTFAPPLAD